MSNTEKIYVGNSKDIQGKYGTIQKISYSRKDLETMMANLNEKGYVNLNRLQKKEADKYGNTHYMVIDTYVAPAKENDYKANPNRKTAADNIKQPQGQAQPFEAGLDLPF